MVRRRRATQRRRGGRTPGGRRGKVVSRSNISAPVRRIPPYPPLLDIQANIITVWLRRSFGFGTAASTYTASLKADEIFRYHSSLQAAFTQYRVMLLNVWFLPDQGTTAEGQYSAMLVDAGIVKGTPSFNDVMATPGSVMRKMYQVAPMGWRPTEPDDRNWTSTASGTKTIAELYMVSSSTTKTMDGNFVMDYHVQLRGHNSNETFKSRVLQMLPDLGLIASPIPSPESADMCD